MSVRPRLNDLKAYKMIRGGDDIAWPNNKAAKNGLVVVQLL